MLSLGFRELIIFFHMFRGGILEQQIWDYPVIVDIFLRQLLTGRTLSRSAAQQW